MGLEWIGILDIMQRRCWSVGVLVLQMLGNLVKCVTNTSISVSGNLTLPTLSDGSWLRWAAPRMEQQFISL